MCFWAGISVEAEKEILKELKMEGGYFLFRYLGLPLQFRKLNIVTVIIWLRRSLLNYKTS